MRKIQSVRLSLVGFVLALMIPTVAAAVAAIVYVYNEERQAFHSGLVETTRALSQVIDGEIARRESVLKTLAESPTLTRRDLAAFHAYAKQIAPANDTTIVLSDLQGRQLLNTRRAFGEPVPASTVFAALRANAGPVATLVSDIYFAPLGRQHSFAVEVPVVRDGTVIYYLSMGSFVQHLHRILENQRLPEGWIGSILDRTGAVAARTHNVDQFVGRRPHSVHLARAEQSQGAAFRIPSLEGPSVLAAFSRSPRYGWAAFIGVPEAAVTSPVRIAGAVALVAVLLLAWALWMAVWFGRRIVRPIERLSAAAEGLRRGDTDQAIETGLEETDKVAAALAQAGAAIHQARDEQEQRVREALDEAERAHRAVVRSQRLEAVGQLTGGVAHDFNNLLMVVATNVHLLKRHRAALEDDQPLLRIERAVSTGTKLTRQLLAFARRQPIRPQVIDPASVLPDLLELVRPTLTGGVRLQFDVAPGTPCIEVDPAEFELAIINLAVNARDAMPDGGELTVRARGEGGNAVIEVTDTGTGIDRAILDKVFEPFFTTKEVGRGTGLGLSQVYGMATQAGGSAQIESEAGRGTTVRIMLPAAVARPPEEIPAPSATEPMLGCTVLLVEDNAELAHASRELLAGAGCTVHCAATGDEAKRVLDTLAPFPQAVLSDIRMPGETDGIALAAWLRKEWPGLPIVLMTGYTAELEAARAMRLVVLAKPAQPAELLQALATAMRRRSGTVAS